MMQRGVSSAISASPMLTTAKRNFFVEGTGEVGIWGKTMKKATDVLMYMTFIGVPIFSYKIIYRAYNPDKQWITGNTDKWFSDGTEMKGEEATANLRIQRERIMPIMDKYLEKIENSQ